MSSFCSVFGRPIFATWDSSIGARRYDWEESGSLYDFVGEGRSVSIISRFGTACIRPEIMSTTDKHGKKVGSTGLGCKTNNPIPSPTNSPPHGPLNCTKSTHFTRVSRVLSVCKGLHRITSLYAMSQLVITVISAILNSQQFQVGMEEP